jgi:hypothetical protein
MPELIRKGQAAQLLGVSAPRVSQLLQAGHLSEVPGTGMLSRAEVEQFAQSRDGLGVHQVHQRAPINAKHPERSQPAPPRGGADSSSCAVALPPIAVSRQRLEALRAQIAQHDLDARNNKLVSRKEVERAAFEEGRRIRQALEGLPFRLGHALAGALGLDALRAGYIVQDVMAQEIRQLLLTLAGEPDAGTTD